MTDTLRPATSRSVTFDEGETDVRRMRGIGIVAIVSIMLASCALPPRPSGTPAQPAVVQIWEYPAGDVPTMCVVLTADGVAVVSVPNKAFEEFWTDLAGEDNPYHVHVPDLEEFVGMLAGFPWVDFHGQIDVVASLVLPLDGNEGERVRGSLEVQAGTSITDRGTVTILGVCHVRRPVERPPRAPEACSYGNYQDTFGGAIASNQALATFAGSDFVRANLGQPFQHVYTVLKQQEMDEFDRQVTPMEYDACL